MSDTKVIVDCATGEVSTVNLTTEEIADRDQAAAEFLERQATEAATAREAFGERGDQPRVRRLRQLWDALAARGRSVLPIPRGGRRHHPRNFHQRLRPVYLVAS